jgi:uncharacterized Zn finger protein
MAGRRSFQSGLLYAAEGRVGKLTADASSVEATVRGSSSYRVKLSLNDDDEPRYECSCPVGLEGRFCKHAVAVALITTEAVADPGGRHEAEIDVRAHLMRLDQATLVDMLLERAAEDDIFEARLRMDAAGATAGPPQLAAYRQAIDEVFMVGDYVGYREMYDYAANMDWVLDSLQQVLDAGHADAVIELCEHAVDRAEDAVGYVDDSDGWMSTIADRLRDLHLAACIVVRPDPATLARTLYDRERHSGDLDVFRGAASVYAEVLGAEGLGEYRELAQAEWDALPPLGPSDDDLRWSRDRFAITHIMETLAQLAGDVDALVDVLARDQSSSYQFVRIVEVLGKAQRYDGALAWAEKGLALHGGSDPRLVQAVVEEYHRAGRGEDAVRVAWNAYDQAPAVGTYRLLAEQAKRADLWRAWHDKALELLRFRIEQSARKRARDRAPHQVMWAPESSTLVEVLLFDGDEEAAWAQATAAGCRRDLWLELARLREREHPLDAIPIWQGEVERHITAKNNQAYAEAVELIARVGRLMEAAGRAADFAPYVASVRASHKPKRNLMKLFDERSWLAR